MLEAVRDAASKRSEKQPISVLIVDDNSFLVDSFKLIMEFAGFKVETARSGDEALRKARTIRFDLALVDLNLPDLSGAELSSTLKENTPSMSVMLLTGSAGASDKGVDGVIANPIDPEELIKISRSLNDNL